MSIPRALWLFFVFLSPFLPSPSLALHSTNLTFPSIEMPPFAGATEGACGSAFPSDAAPAPQDARLELRLHRHDDARSVRKRRVIDSALRDASRIDYIRRRTTPGSGDGRPRRALAESAVAANVESGVPLGAGEYLVNMFVGTPPQRFLMIMDTGSDLNWLQCAPCRACFSQHGPVFDPAASSSYRAVECGDTRCALVAAGPDTSRRACRAPGDPCPYFYWYGDRSNTTGDLAVDVFTVNLTSGGALSRSIDGVVFGCGHWNRGLFHGAAGLLGLGRGRLSFTSQLRELFGHRAFSYCLVDHGSGSGVSSKVVFGEDRALLEHPQLNHTSFVAAGNGGHADTFYYVRIKEILVGGDKLDIPADTWELKESGGGGTIVDSGTTLSYFAEPAFQIIREAFERKVGDRYPTVADFPVLSPCYNVSGAGAVELPGFVVVFADGAAWNFPPENYFIWLEQEEIVCLAILGVPRSAMSIIGNYQQQNFHVLFDLEKDRLGFAPRRCAEV